MEFKEVIKTSYCYVLRHSSVTLTPEQWLQRASEARLRGRANTGIFLFPAPGFGSLSIVWWMEPMLTVL